MRRFYEFRQNNSGGRFFGEQYLFVEATSPEQANALAEQWGVYFGGVAAGRDCECCGDRWHRVDEYDQTYTFEEVCKEVEEYNLQPGQYAVIMKENRS